MPRFLRRYSSMSYKTTKRRLPKYKSSPIEGRAPEPTFRSRPPPDAPLSEPVLPHTPSFYARILNRIPPSYRRTIGTTLITAPFVMMVWLHCPLQIMWTNGGSMSPFFNPNSSPDLPETNDKILVQSLAYASRKSRRTDTGGTQGYNVQRGQIIVFKNPLNPDKIAVKRVVGIPGDRVRPLPGYAGGSDPVVVQYNHIWVEGDVDNRDKSFDSNWYGSISQNLVVGKVVALLEPWYRPTQIKIEEHKYPAKQRGRVEENAVQDAMMEPDQLDRAKAFADGRVQRDLDMIRNNVEGTVLLIQSSPEQRQTALGFLKGAKAEMAKNDPRTLQLATELAEVVEEALVAAGYTRDDLKRWGASVPNGKKIEEQPASLKVESTPPEQIPEPSPKQSEEGPAQRALREHQERQMRERLEGNSNGLDDSERQALWKEQARLMSENAERVKAEAARGRAASQTVKFMTWLGRW
jgi:signal peptidase I